MDAQGILNTLARRLARRIGEVEALLRIDRAVGADPYDDVARLRELQRVRKWITELGRPGATPVATEAGSRHASTEQLLRGSSAPGRRRRPAAHRGDPPA